MPGDLYERYLFPYPDHMTSSTQTPGHLEGGHLGPTWGLGRQD